MSIPTEVPASIPDPLTPGMEDGAKCTRDFGATPVWVWNEGQVGGPFAFREVAQLEAERGRVPGMLGRVEGGEWMPWPDLEKWVAAQAAQRQPAQPTGNWQNDTLAPMVVGILVVGLLVCAAVWSQEAFTAIGLILAFVALLAVYFVPCAVARHRQHPQTLAIGVLNVFAGWTFVGWLAALVWACTNARGPDQPKGF